MYHKSLFCIKQSSMPIATHSSTFSLQVQAPAVCQQPDMDPAIPNGSPGEQSKFSSMPPKYCVAQLRFFQNPPLINPMAVSEDICSKCLQSFSLPMPGVKSQLLLFMQSHAKQSRFAYHNREDKSILTGHLETFFNSSLILIYCVGICFITGLAKKC